MTTATNAKFSNGELVKCFGRTYKVIASAKDWCKNVYIYSLKDLHSGHYVSRDEVDVYPITQKGDTMATNAKFNDGELVWCHTTSGWKVGKVLYSAENNHGSITCFLRELESSLLLMRIEDHLLPITQTGEAEPSSPDFQVGDRVYVKDSPTHPYRHLPRMGEIRSIYTCKSGTSYEIVLDVGNTVIRRGEQLELSYTSKNNSTQKPKLQVAEDQCWPDSTNKTDFGLGDRVWVTIDTQKTYLGTIVEMPSEVRIHVEVDYNQPIPSPDRRGDRRDIVIARYNELRLAGDQQYWPDSKHSQDNFKDAVKHVLRNQISPYASDDEPVSHDQLRAIAAQVTNVTVGDLRKMARERD